MIPADRKHRAKSRRGTGRPTPSLNGLIAADRAEFGPRQPGHRRIGKHWSQPELQVIERYARAVLSGKYAHAVLAVDDCRAALARLARPEARTGAQPSVRSRVSVHRMLILFALKLGRKRSRARWLPAEKAVLDRFARAVAENRYQTAREAGPVCRDAITALHRRFPARFAGIPERSIHTIQHELWPRVAKLRFRWFNSNWSQPELDLIDRYARRALAHRCLTLRHAARECCVAINRLLARIERRRTGRSKQEIVRTVPAVYDQLFTRTRELGPNQLPYRRWTAAEQRVAARWASKYFLHRRGKLRMNRMTIAGLMQAELGRLGYYRGLTACATEVFERWRRLSGRTRAGKERFGERLTASVSTRWPRKPSA
jgi:hypothetical protein